MKSRMTWLRVGGTAFLIALNAARATEPTAPLRPIDERASFQFADNTLTAQLVAAEPDVVSPVAIAWDADGRMWVAEMRDYPNATNGGTIRLLQDRGPDGRYRKSTLFAEGLRFPNSVLPWKGGVLVTAAPDLLFLQDHDGDGRADERRVLFTGFGTGNQQLRANGLTWGQDGWVYGANGRSDGNVHRPGETNFHSLRGRDFRFRPSTGEFETLAGRSQFGLALDDWGQRFLSWNTIPLRHEVFPDRYLARNPDLPATEVLVDLLPADDNGQVYPLTPPPLVFNNESSSHFNALAGLTIYRGDALGSKYRGNAFVGETLRNLVHRRIVRPEGATFSAARGEESSEFLRSSDPWFHPVNFATGPDGALYLVDFYRQFVEHPDFVPREMRDAVGWRTGSEHGRIWRLSKKSPRPEGSASPTKLAQASARTLVHQLESSNVWVRETAQRLLVERNGHPDQAALRILARTAKQPETRALSLQTLEQLAALNEADVLSGLKDSSPNLRELALRLAERFVANAPSPARIRAAVLGLAEDLAVRVRLQAALTFGALPEDAARENALNSIIEKDPDRWVRLAALSSSRTRSKAQLSALLPIGSRPLRPPPVLAAPAPDRQRVVEQFTPALKLAGDRTRGAVTFEKLCLACHYLQGHGQRVGPDLSGVATRPVDALLLDLLDPSRQVAPDFAAYEVVLKNGEVVTGLFASETETRITIRRAGAPDENIPRSQIQSLRPTGKSLMPDGLEAGLSTAQIADLLAFLQHPDGTLLSP